MDIYSSVVQKQLGKNSKPDKEKKNEKQGKSRNKKVVHDLFVQGTNDSSIVSKRSVEILYNDVEASNSKPFFHHFVKKSPRRTPVINRGYWIRMKSIRMAIEKIIEQQPPEQRINIINLGCGYDPLPFQLLDEEKFQHRNLYCIDVDFPELIDYKSQMIRMAPELTTLIGPQLCDSESKIAPGVVIRTANYATMGCDLTNRKLYCEQLDSFKANSPSTTNIFIAEVSLAYMTPETANPIIETSSTFSNSHFLILEQLLPAGENHPFGKRMIHHFNKMEAPLQCVHTYPTIADQINRFRKLGYNHVNAKDLLACWDLVPNDIKLKVKNVEAFDEWEEFIFFGHHYINLHATNQPNVTVYAEKYCELYPQMKSAATEYTVQYQNELPVNAQRKFHSCLGFPNASFLTCGIQQSRLSDTIQLKLSTDNDAVIQVPTDFKARVGATSIDTRSGSYLVGGRRIPGAGMDEVWKLHRVKANHYTWELKSPLLSGRVKHTAACINEEDILIFGGSDGETFEYYSNESNIWFKLDYSSDSIFLKGLESSKLVVLDTTNEIYLLGGMIYDPAGGFDFSSTVYQVELDLESKKIFLTEIVKHKSLARYGFNVVTTGSKILVIGGVGKTLYCQNDTIVEVDIDTKKVASVRINESLWRKSPVFVGSDVISRKSLNQSWIIGGGVVCYGFGSVWGGIVSINFGEQPSERIEFQ